MSSSPSVQITEGDEYTNLLALDAAEDAVGNHDLDLMLADRGDPRRPRQPAGVGDGVVAGVGRRPGQIIAAHGRRCRQGRRWRRPFGLDRLRIGGERRPCRLFCSAQYSIVKEPNVRRRRMRYFKPKA